MDGTVNELQAGEHVNPFKPLIGSGSLKLTMLMGPAAGGVNEGTLNAIAENTEPVPEATLTTGAVSVPLAFR